MLSCLAKEWCIPVNKYFKLLDKQKSAKNYMPNCLKTLIYLHDIKIPYICTFSKIRVLIFFCTGQDQL